VVGKTFDTRNATHGQRGHVHHRTMIFNIDHVHHRTMIFNIKSMFIIPF